MNMPPLWIADATPSGEWTGTAATVIAGLLGLLAWFVKYYLGDLREAMKQAILALKDTLVEIKEEMKRNRIATEENTKVVAMSLLAVAHLTPGSQPILQNIKEGVERRLQGNTP